MEFDYHMLSNLPIPAEHNVKRVLEVLQSIINQRIVPYFRNKRGADLIQLARIKQSLALERWEDDSNQARLVSLVVRSSGGWTIRIHERVFDYMAFVIPLKPEYVLADGNMDERRMLAFAEFMLRHNVEHLLHPERREQEIISSDIDFAMGWRKNDPTSYHMLRSALSDEMNGIRGRDYIEILDSMEQGKPTECAVNRIVSRYIASLGELPANDIEEVFTDLDTPVKTKILGDYYRKSRSTSYSLGKRSSSFQRVLRLFSLLMRHDRNEAMEIFTVMKDRWGLVALFHELEQSEVEIEEKDSDELFEIFSEQLKKLGLSSEARRQVLPGRSAQSRVAPEPVKHAAPPPPPKTLKERIEEARNNPRFPRQAMELIDKNKQNAAGQSGAKYTELIETLLAIPWGTIRKIEISPAEFEEGLERSHHGLHKPKEIICDIFANLIWRYQHFNEEDRNNWRHTGSAILLVGPPGVGKTSLAISVARNLGIPYHKLSLGGMKDEADIRGYGFTYEGSKPGPIVQGLIKMGMMNGMFILDEADKTEKFAIATLLEILDPEQNHLFHDKYTQSTIDIDLSNCHFVLTANTLETVPAAVLDRCEIIVLNRYSVEEKIAIARKHLIQRVRGKYMIGEREIFLDPKEESDLLRLLIRNYTFEAGVRDLERILRTLFLRVHRKEILAKSEPFVGITREKIKEYLEDPGRPRHINEEDRVGEMMALGVNMEMGVGSLIPIQATPVKSGELDEGGRRGHMSILHATGNIEKVMDESRKVATTAIFHSAEQLGIDLKAMDDPVHLHFMGGSSKKDGPSAGGAIALALSSFFRNRRIRRDVAMTGEIDTQGRITGIGGLGVKLETAYAAGCKTMIIPKENLQGRDGIERLPEALKQELQILTYKQWKEVHEPFDYTRHVMQVVAVEHITEAADIAFIDQDEIDALDSGFISHAEKALQDLAMSAGPSITPLCIIHVTDPDEVDSELLQSDFCKHGHGCVILAKGKTKRIIESKLSESEGRVVIREFAPQNETLTEVIRELALPLIDSSPSPLRISVIAPLTVLLRDGIREEDFPAEPGFAGLNLFASCCTVENVQIRDCTNLINRAFRQLARLRPPLLDETPFAVGKDGIHTVSLSFIPEKYRLDPKRSEEILHRGLTTWLALMERDEEESEVEELDGDLVQSRMERTATA
jgi:ATP-dependent Lon protease